MERKSKALEEMQLLFGRLLSPHHVETLKRVGSGISGLPALEVAARPEAYYVGWYVIRLCHSGVLKDGRDLWWIGGGKTALWSTGIGPFVVASRSSGPDLAGGEEAEVLTPERALELGVEAPAVSFYLRETLLRCAGAHLAAFQACYMALGHLEV